ncbi:MAG: hypothetical protein ACLQDM_11085 [Bradyrhizobium sp.]
MSVSLLNFYPWRLPAKPAEGASRIVGLPLCKISNKISNGEVA